jgi:hypothetical protein
MHTVLYFVNYLKTFLTFRLCVKKEFCKHKTLKENSVRKFFTKMIARELPPLILNRFRKSRVITNRFQRSNANGNYNE